MTKADHIAAVVAEKDAEIAELRLALRSAVIVANEAQEEWDKAPEGMRAGKILLALAGHRKGFRQDTDKIHAILAKYKA